MKWRQRYPAPLLIGAWLGVYWVPNILGSDFFRRAVAGASGVLLSFAIFIGFTSAARGSHRVVNVISAVGATVALITRTYFLFFNASAVLQFAALDLDGGPSIERITQAAWKAKNAKGRELAARLAFGEFGVRISYLDEAGSVRVFEPTPEQADRWGERRKTRADLASVRPKLLIRAAAFEWEGNAYLLSLGGVFALGSIGFLFRRKTHNAADAPAAQD